MSNYVGPRIINKEVAEANFGLLRNSNQNIGILLNLKFRNTIYTVRLFVVVSQKSVKANSRIV